MRRPGLFAVAALAVAGAALLAITVGGIGKNLVYYWGPTELHAAGDKAYGATIRLGGLVAEGSIDAQAGGSALEFDVIDRRAAACTCSAPACRRRCSARASAWWSRGP